MRTAVVVGGGVGGLAAAIVLAARGLSVTVCEASPFFGGLASALDVEGTRFDGGPYILLDPVGLAWAFEALGIAIGDLALSKVTNVYQVERDGSPPVRIAADLEETAAGLDEAYPGQGDRYRRFVARMASIHAALAPLQVTGRPSRWLLVRQGLLRHAPFLMQSLAGVLRRAGFTAEVADALAIWTHIAGQGLDTAPSLAALVPAMIHGPGCFVPERGVAGVAERVLVRARELGVSLRHGARVRRILTDARRVTGIELESGERLAADAVVSDASGVATLLELAPAPPRLRARVASLTLQSPGVGAYVLAEQQPTGPYLRFRLARQESEGRCRLLVRPGALTRPGASTRATSDAHPTRIVAPLSQALAERTSEAEQGAFLDAIVDDPWVRAAVGPFREVARLVPASWGRRHVLHRNSMNPAMTGRFMRQGRLPHRIDDPAGLFLVGSSTHPGQWVSFCLISGVLGAREALRRWRRWC
jgi:phytoene dehydrogenase-like protein